MSSYLYKHGGLRELISMRKLLDHEVPTKICVYCQAKFSKRKANGNMYSRQRWAEKVCCSNKCHLQYSWDKRRESVPDRFWRQVVKLAPNKCWQYSGGARDSKGYGGFHLEGKKMMRAHRVAYILTYGPIDEGLVVRHKCDNPPCCNPNHLELGTIADNNADRDSRGRHVALGRDYHGSAKLSTLQLQQLREEYAQLPCGPGGIKRKKGTVKALAEKYNITTETACTLGRNNSTWTTEDR